MSGPVPKSSTGGDVTTVGLIPAGKLRTRILFEVEVQTPDGQGGFKPDWATFTGLTNGKWWCWLTPYALRSHEASKRDQLTAGRVYWVQGRYFVGLLPNMRLTILNTGAKCQIREIFDVDQAHRWYKLMIEETTQAL